MELTNDIMHPKVALTKNTELISGTHILYLYSNWDKYWDNILSFVTAGLELQHRVILLESSDMLAEMRKRLFIRGFGQEQIESIVFVDHRLFYGAHQSFDMETVLKTLKNSIQHYVEKGLPTRVWSHVFWHKDACCEKELQLYEQKADAILKPLNTFTVCSYNADEISASLSMGLMKGHSHVMTDDELAASMYYKSELKTPSLFIEDRLQEKVGHYKHLINEMPDAVFIVSDYQIVYGNHAAAKMLKCETGDLSNVSAWTIFCEEYHDVIRQRVKKLQLKEKLSLAEMKMKTYEGDILDVEIGVFPFSLDIEKDSTAILIIRSIQERKAHQQLTIKTEKLSLAGQLAASIAHEVRNPLTSIKGFIKLAREDVMQDAYYTIIEEEIDRIETIASELLVLGKPMSVEVDVCDVGKMLRDVCILLQSQAVMRKIDIQFHSAEPGCFIRCNAGQVKQVFINIIKNATEAMEDGGIIRASVRPDGETVQVIIEDEGKGMPEHILQKLGEPFYSTKEDGTGLGLMVCFNIVEQYGGTIRIESIVDEGTVFTIQLPAESS
ncbi:ATP-binding protein [Domibacillus tundrae]|uniref:ATP-binding protein n=1 Tax=Domibacillus tundrae TaxID=1587527 RepID=UPI00069644F3|nr:ATP-binding protein [Domibacillus tundrae]